MYYVYHWGLGCLILKCTFLYCLFYFFLSLLYNIVSIRHRWPAMMGVGLFWQPSMICYYLNMLSVCIWKTKINSVSLSLSLSLSHTHTHTHTRRSFLVVDQSSWFLRARRELTTFFLNVSSSWCHRMAPHLETFLHSFQLSVKDSTREVCKTETSLSTFSTVLRLVMRPPILLRRSSSLKEFERVVRGLRQAGI